MSFPEYTFHPNGFLAPDTDAGGGSCGSFESCESPRRIEPEQASKSSDLGFPTYENSHGTLASTGSSNLPFDQQQDTSDEIGCLLSDSLTNMQITPNYDPQLTVGDSQGASNYYPLVGQQSHSSEYCASNIPNSNEAPDNFVWTEDLSSNAQKLWFHLLGDVDGYEFLQWRASTEEWDLEAAVQELEDYGLLDRSEPGRLRIVRKYRGYD